MRTLVVSGMALIAATYGLARFGYGLFLPRFTETFQMGSTLAGAVQAGSFLSYCCAALTATRLGARPRLVVVCAGSTATVGAAGVALAPHVGLFALGVIVAGAGAGFATPGLVTLIERNVAAARQENAQTVVNAGTGAGIVVAGILLILTAGHWRVGWLVIALAAGLATVATLRADRSTPRRRRPGRPSRVKADDVAALARPLVAATLAGASSAAIWTFGRSVMADSGAGDETLSIAAWMVLGAFGILGAAAGKIVQTWSLRIAWVATTAVMATATVLLGVAPGIPPAAYVSVAAFGAGYTAMSGVLIVWAVRVVPDLAAEGTVVLFIALAVGQAAGSVALGVLLGASPVLAFVVAGALGILAVLPAVRDPAAAGSRRATR
ncbi:MFS transporter [Rhodococcus sp. (in: high G+C Gram-positive bacteria)]|uniref:MFS transporter n=1 Tax=Rhodococcus sp. TaxID=1831 RepID=UPI0019E36D95|nr:MFS transporter [Rhodococcus sp. (in: high G+C Gram-positive bacteria)]MBF0660900.1 MFS transporter [Rhodococcus sp. (in: high G+C Gram-positive bacteria)]